MDALKKAYQAIDQEGDRAISILMGSAMIALHRYYGYRELRLAKVISKLTQSYVEAKTTEERSMIQILEEETGLEIQIGNGISWRDLPYLNDKLFNEQLKNKEISRAKLIYMRQRQIKWIYPLVLASILVSMHRTYGFSCERVATLASQIQAVEEEYGHDPKTIIKQCAEETGIKYELIGLSTLFVYPPYPMCKKCNKAHPDNCIGCAKKLQYEKDRGITNDD